MHGMTANKLSILIDAYRWGQADIKHHTANMYEEVNWLVRYEYIETREIKKYSTREPAEDKEGVVYINLTEKGMAFVKGCLGLRVELVPTYRIKLETEEITL